MGVGDKFQNDQAMTTPGYLVKTKKGLRGRTYHNKGLVNNKTPVYLEKSEDEFEEQAILCDPLSLTKIGFID